MTEFTRTWYLKYTHYDFITIAILHKNEIKCHFHTFNLFSNENPEILQPNLNSIHNSTLSSLTNLNAAAIQYFYRNVNEHQSSQRPFNNSPDEFHSESIPQFPSTNTQYSDSNENLIRKQTRGVRG